MEYTVYIIKSINKNYSYVWMTNNLERRLKEHNSNKSKSTKSYSPFELIYSEKLINSVEARKREIFLKSWQWRLRRKNNLQ